MSAQPNLGMQVTTFENPMGIDGFEFVEYAAPAGRADGNAGSGATPGCGIVTSSSGTSSSLIPIH